MIRSITMKSVTSFSKTEAEKIDIGDKRVLLFYGLNGTGKSTIANFLQDRSESCFSSCILDSSEGYEPELVVYNQKFVEDNFLQSSTQPGVFTLSKENKEAKQAIEQATQEIQKLEEETKKIDPERERLIQLKIRNTEAIKNKIWETKAKFENTPLESCMSGRMGSRGRFLGEVQSTPYELNTDDFDKLTKEASELQNHDGKEKVFVSKLESNLFTTESNSVFKEIIVGSGDSYLSQLISSLSNSDWVKKGADYLGIEGEKCPFCQQDLPDGFESEIQNLFDETYQKKIDELANLNNQYKTEINRISTALSAEEFRDTYVKEDAEFDSIKDKYLALLQENLRKINEKMKSPSEQVALDDSSVLLAALNERIEGIRSKMEVFNNKIANSKTYLQALRVRFWKSVRAKYQDALLNYQEEVDRLDIEIKQKDAQLKQIRDSVNSHRTTISEHREKVTNIDLSIENINKQITLLGIEGFRIEKADSNSNFYTLRRDNNMVDVYKTLSEGEKTLITFLYFLELCQGSHESAGAVDLKNRIIVIDDPISSLSHNYVYDIASLIHHRVIEAEFRQIFVLTHNLFFFHELLRLKNQANDCPKDYKLYRITKRKSSRILGMRRDEIKNDYQSYWIVIKDSLEGKVSSVVLPNTMRNILEYYFNFVHQVEKLHTALGELAVEDNEFKPLERYIKRGSHADAINITDFGAIDPGRYLTMFKKVFQRTGFEDHFNTMMGAGNADV